MSIFRGIPKALSAVLLVSVSFLYGCAENEGTDYTHLDALIKDVKARTDMASGTAVIVVKGDKIVHEGYFGFADVEAQQPVDEETVFYIASTTKAFMSLAILLAEERGDVSGNTTLQQLFPDLVFDHIDADSITVKHLLTHTSGIDNEPLTWSMSYSGLHGPAEKRRAMIAASYPAKDVVLGEFEYSNIGYNIMAVWLDEKYGRDWRETFRETLLDPLGMTRATGFVSVAEQEAWPLARPYSYKVGGGRSQLYLRKMDDTMYAVGLLATARDTARFITASMNDGMIVGEQVFPPHVLQKQRARQVETDGGYFDGYAWGWMTAQQYDRRLMLHTGGFSGASVSLSYMPDEKIGLVVISNENGLKANALNGIVQKAAYGTALGMSDEDIQEQVRKNIEWVEKTSKDARGRLAKAAEDRQAAPWDMSLPLAAYAGKYSHPYAGDIIVELKDEKGLKLKWGLLRGTAFPSDKTNQVVVDFRPGSYDPLEFIADNEKVTGLTFNDVEFFRK